MLGGADSVHVRYSESFEDGQALLEAVTRLGLEAYRSGLCHEWVETKLIESVGNCLRGIGGTNRDELANIGAYTPRKVTVSRHLAWTNFASMCGAIKRYSDAWMDASTGSPVSFAFCVPSTLNGKGKDAGQSV